ncbi:MAG: undecaprenyl-diphosphate phosphatase [Muribaculaceae bacterium]|nr:undecaprenyl-diphosphate phosphatase [Muribaculaceae bacterium]
MEWLDAFILGLVQGLAEYLPVSSSGHLQIFREILGIDLPNDVSLQFDILLHAATVLSTIVILWPLFKRLFAAFFSFRRDADFWYVCKILISCIPIAVVGFVFKDLIEDSFNNILVVGICLCVTAALLCFAHFSDCRDGRLVSPEKGRDIGWWDALVIGCAQAVAVLPGLSRSGTTIATGILIGDKRSKVAAFSFLMVIIPILGEALLDLYKMVSAHEPVAGAPGTAEVSVGALIIGFFTAFIVGCAACRWMLSLVRRGKLVWFAVYCVAVGVICILWHCC